jgi:hypothetical protein
MTISKKRSNAQRGENPATSWLQVRVTPAEKAKVVRDARGEKLSLYVRRKLGLDS